MAYTEALAARQAGKEIVSDYSSDSNPTSGYYSDSSYEFDFGSDPIDTESEVTTAEEPLSGPATGLVITSTAAGRFVYWPDRMPADLIDGNSRCVAYLDSLPFQEGTPLATTEEHSSTEVPSTDSGLGTPDRQVFMAAGETSQKTSYLPTRPLMKPLTARTPDVNAIGSKTNGADVSVRSSPFEISPRPWTK
jgi:hypothetical protein